MPAISKEQFLALAYGVYQRNLATANSNTKFTGIAPSALLASGVDTITSSNIASATTTIPLASTANMKVGDTVTRLSGAVTMTGDRTIQSIVENTSITVSGANLGGTFPGTITIAVGGIDLTNEQITYAGNPARQAFTLATSSSTISSVSVANNGGDLNKGGTLENFERDYHTTGRGLRKKLK